VIGLSWTFVWAFAGYTFIACLHACFSFALGLICYEACKRDGGLISRKSYIGDMFVVCVFLPLLHFLFLGRLEAGFACVLVTIPLLAILVRARLVLFWTASSGVVSIAAPFFGRSIDASKISDVVFPRFPDYMHDLFLTGVVACFFVVFSLLVHIFYTRIMELIQTRSRMLAMVSHGNTSIFSFKRAFFFFF